MLNVLVTSLMWMGWAGTWSPIVAEVDTFRAADHAPLMQWVPTEEQKAFEEALISVGSNWPELAKTVEEAAPAKVRQAVVQLILDMPPIDRAEGTSEIFLDHSAAAVLARAKVPYPVPEELFVEYVLNFRLDSEQVSAWRRMLFDHFFPLIEKADSASEAARRINRWIADHTETRPPQEIRQIPLATFRDGRGSPSDLCILLGAALRAVCIPARMIYVYALAEEPGQAFWVEAFVDGVWTPLYPSHPEAFGDFGWMERSHPHNLIKVTTRYGPYWEDKQADEGLDPTEDRTADYTPVGRLAVTVNGLKEKEYVDVVVSVFNKGSWIPVARGTPDLFVLGDGDVLATVGRPKVQLVTQRVTIRPGELTTLSLMLPSE